MRISVNRNTKFYWQTTNRIDNNFNWDPYWTTDWITQLNVAKWNIVDINNVNNSYTPKWRNLDPRNN